MPLITALPLSEAEDFQSRSNYGHHHNKFALGRFLSIL